MKTYSAYLSQTGTDHPSAVIECNTYGQELQLLRVAEGTYRIIGDGAFNGPTFVQIGNYRHENGAPHNWQLNAGRINDDTINITQDAFTGDELITGDAFVCFIEIRTH